MSWAPLILHVADTDIDDPRLILSFTPVFSYRRTDLWILQRWVRLTNEWLQKVKFSSPAYFSLLIIFSNISKHWKPHLALSLNVKLFPYFPKNCVIQLPIYNVCRVCIAPPIILVFVLPPHQLCEFHIIHTQSVFAFYQKCHIENQGSQLYAVIKAMRLK